MEQEKSRGRSGAVQRLSRPYRGKARAHGAAGNTINAASTETSNASEDVNQPDAAARLLHGLPISTLDAIPDAVFLYDHTGRVIFVNRHAAEIYGLPSDPTFFDKEANERAAQVEPRSLTGAPLLEEQWHLTRLLKGEVISSDAPSNVVINALDGGEVALSYTGAPITEPDTGRIIGAIAVARDITEQQRATAEREQALRDEQEARALAEVTARELEAIQTVSDVGLKDLDADTLMQELLGRVREALSADSAAILLRSAPEGPGAEVLVVRAAQGMETVVADRVRVRVGKGFAGRIVSGNRPLIVEDFRSFDVENPFLKEELRSAIGAPLSVGGRVFGAIHVDSAAPRIFTPQEVRLLELVASRVAVAIDRAETQRLADKEAARARALAAEMETVFESMTDGVTLYDSTGAVRRVNRAYRNMLGLEDEHLQPEIIERGLGLAPRRPDGTPLLREEWPALRILGGETLTGDRALDVLVRSLDGRDVLVNCAGAPVLGPDGGVVAGVMVIREVSERRRLESLARQAQELAVTRARELESIIEVMSDAVVVIDRDGQITQRNSAALRLYAQSTREDWSKREMRERTGTFKLLKATGEQLEPGEWPAARALKGETISPNESGDVYYEDNFGHEVWLNAAAAPLKDAAGAITGAVIVYRDVTARRLLERRTRQSLDAVLAMAGTLVDLPSETQTGTVDQGTPATTDPSQVGALDVDVTASSERGIAQRLAELTAEVLGCNRVGIVAIDPATERMRAVAVVGLGSEQERQWWQEQRAQAAAGARISDGVDPDVVARFHAGEVLVIDMRDEPYRNLPNPYNVTTQLVAPMRIGDQLVGVISLDFGGPPHQFTADEHELAAAVAQLGAVALERNRLLRDREEARVRAVALAESNEQMNTFVGIAGHELRTPLTSAKANIQMAARIAQRLVEGKIEQKALERLVNLTRRIESQLLRQERLVEDLLDVSRIQEGKLQLRLAECNLAHVVSTLVEELGEQHPDRTITLEAPAGGAKALVWADADRVGQAVTNFLTNALKYSPATVPVEVRVTVDGDQARFVAQDHGPGLPPDELERIWDRFHRSPDVKVQSGSNVGLGLGLYITREMIERQGGQVGVESALGEGSSFWFTLPLAANTPERSVNPPLPAD